MSSQRNIVLLVVIAIVSRLVQFYRSKNWFIKPVAHTNDFLANANYTMKDIKITYYEKGRLHEVLPMWPEYKNAEPYIHVYRLKTNGSNDSDFNFDWSIMNITTFAKQFDESCSYPNSVICSPCYSKSNISDVNILDKIINQPFSNYYSTFAKLTDHVVVAKLFSYLNLPGFNFDKFNFEHAFISNLKVGRITAPMHANIVTNSMGVQYAGKKTWLFFPPNVVKGEDMLNAFPGSGSAILTQSPKKPYEMSIVTTIPGDILFFSENQGHIVWTHPGPNLLMNFRLFHLYNFLRQPLYWLLGVFNVVAYSDKTFFNKKITPFNALIDRIYYNLDHVCSAERGNSPWDNELIEFIQSHIEGA